MGIVKLQNSAIPNRKEHFTFTKKNDKKKLKETANKALEWYSWWVNTVNIPLVCLSITTMQMLLTSVPSTHAEDLFSRFSGNHLDLLNNRLEQAKIEAEVNNIKTKAASTEILQKEWKMTEVEKLEAEIAYIKRNVKGEKWIEYLKKLNIVLNPIARGAREVININKNDPLQCRRIIRRLIEKDGFVNNFILEFVDWYECHLFPAVIMNCSVGMFIPVFIGFLMSGIGLGLQMILPSVAFRNSPVRSIILVLLSIILFILLIVVWIAVWPLSISLIFGSFLNIFFWPPYILMFHLKDLFCEQERGGYIRNPLLLPYARSVCNIFNYLFDTIVWVLDFIPGAVDALKLDKIECENEREVLRKICKIFGGIYDIIWEYVIVASLIVIQILFLYYALVLKVLSIVNPITIIEALDKPGKTIKFKKVDFKLFQIPPSKITIKIPFLKKWFYPIYNPITKYFTLKKWSDSMMDWVNSISCIDSKIYKTNKKVITIPINTISKLIGGGNLINFKECKKTK